MSEKRKRTRDGCIVCRRRRKRCDLRKPTCGGCERNALLCRWALTSVKDQLPVGTEVIISMRRSSPFQMSRVNPGVASHMLKAPISSLLYEHFMHETGNAISAHRGPLNSFIRILPCLAMYYPSTVLQGLLALSGVHYGSRVSNVEVDIMTFTHLGVALRSLKHSLTVIASCQKNDDSLQLLITTLILCFIETIRADQHGKVVHHLNAAHVLFYRLIAPREQTPVDEEVLEFLKEFYVYIRSITVISGSSASQILPSTVVEPATFLLVNQRSPGNLLGCSYELFNLVPQIETLVTLRQNYPATTPKHEVDASWCRYYTLLHTHLSSWRPPEFSSTEFALGGTMYQQALLCFIEMKSPIIDALHLEAMVAFRMTLFLDILKSFPVDAPISSTIVWPLVFFGVLASNHLHRTLIYERLCHMQKMFGFGNIQSSMAFLRLYWDQQCETSGISMLRVSDRTSDLSSIMNHMNLDISFL